MTWEQESIWAKVRPDDLRHLLMVSGFASQGSWGRFMERFQRGKGARAAYVLVPLTSDIADYDDRMREAVYDLARALDIEPFALAKKALIAEHTVFKVRAKPGQDVTSISFEEARAVISNTWRMIRSSAVVALSEGPRHVVHGRAPYGVDTYMERVRLGQTEIGSFVFNFLLPSTNPVLTHGGRSLGIADRVAESLERNIALTAEMQSSKRVPSMEKLEDAGLTANFCSALYNIIDWTGEVSLQIRGEDTADSQSHDDYRFDQGSLSVLERTSERLAPEVAPTRSKVSGTIVRLSEPAKRRRGSVDMIAKIDGRKRNIRVNFTSGDRDTVIQAFKEKDIRLLTVTGYIRTARNGHLTLEHPQGFDATRRGTLL